MKRSELDKIFDDSKIEAYGIDEGEEDAVYKAIIKKMNQYTDKNGNMDIMQVTSFLHGESIAYANNLVYAVLSKILTIEEDL